VCGKLVLNFPIDWLFAIREELRSSTMTPAEFFKLHTDEDLQDAFANLAESGWEEDFNEYPPPGSQAAIEEPSTGQKSGWCWIM
jgi:hypothetical protein